MSVQTERAIKSLFLGNGEQTVNVKFFLGAKRGVTGEELAEQLNRADAQIRSGAAVRSTFLDGDLTENTF